MALRRRSVSRSAFRDCSGRDLAHRVDAGVGAGGAVDGDRVADDVACGFFDFLPLRTVRVGSTRALPAAVGGAVVGDGEFVAFHDGFLGARFNHHNHH